jgi:hypothetical protein
MGEDGTGPAAHLQEEPQEERGAPGSRDTGSDQAVGGPADRPVGTPGKDSDTTVDPQGVPSDAPRLPTGDQGG